MPHTLFCQVLNRFALVIYICYKPYKLRALWSFHLHSYVWTKIFFINRGISIYNASLILEGWNKYKWCLLCTWREGKWSITQLRALLFIRKLTFVSKKEFLVEDRKLNARNGIFFFSIFLSIYQSLFCILIHPIGFRLCGNNSVFGCDARVKCFILQSFILTSQQWVVTKGMTLQPPVG